MKSLNVLVNDRNKKFFKLIIVIIVICSVALNFIVLKEKPCFGASILQEFDETQNGDPIVLSYGGDKYAVKSVFSPYSFQNHEEEPLTRLCGFSYIESVVREYWVYGFENDHNRTFLTCGYELSTDPYSDFAGGDYYKADFEFPEPNSSNIETVELCAYYAETIYLIDDKEMIKWFLGEQTDIKQEDIIKYLHEEFNMDTDEEIYGAYANFANYPLSYALGSPFDEV